MIILTRLALRSRIVTATVLLLALAGGWYAYQQLGQELFPEISLKIISITTTFQQGSSYQVAEEVTRPVEDVVIGIDGVKEVTSTSESGVSSVLVSFETNVDMEAAEEEEVKSLVSGIVLPGAAGDPQVSRFATGDAPVVELSVSGDRDIPGLVIVVERRIAPRLRAVPGVLAVDIEGGIEEQVFVTVDPELLDTYGLTIQDVMGALGSGSVDQTAGSMIAGNDAVTVRAFHGYGSLDAIRQLPVGYVRAERAGSNPSGVGNATPISLEAVADVRVATPEATAISRINGYPSIRLAVRKTPDGNTIAVSHGVAEVLAELETELPPDVAVVVVADQGPELEAELNGVTNQGVQGFAFAVVAVFVFLLQLRPRLLAGILNSLRHTVIIALSIPLSVMLTMVVMAAMDWTLNYMSLAGLAIAVGRIVDDSIVVLENIYRHIQEGSPRAVAVVEATREVSQPVVASTLTTIAVFIPLAFVPGLAGQFFAPFAQTVCVSLAVSTLVALTAVPALAAWLMRDDSVSGEAATTPDDTLLQRAYTPVLRLALRYRLVTVVVCVVVVVASLGIIRVLPTELFSQGGTESLYLELTLDDEPSTGRLFREVVAIERMLDEMTAGGDVERYQATLSSTLGSVGSGSSAPFDRASFTVALTDAAPVDLDERIRESLPQQPGLTAKVLGGSSGPGGGGAGGLQVVLTGPNYEDVRAGAQRLREAVEQDPGVRNVETDITDGREELTIDIDAGAAGRYGLSTVNVADQIRTWLLGSRVAKLDLSGETLDVVVRVEPEVTDDPADLPTLPILSSAGVIPLGTIADIRYTVVPGAVLHHGGHRSATITGDLVGRDAGATGARVQAIIAATPLPPGVEVNRGGLFSDITGEFTNVLVVMGIGIVAVYLVMVATLGSMKIPFIIVLSLPLAVVGALVALLVAGRALSLPAMMGFLMLVGIVVTNAIVLLTFAQQQRRAGHGPLEAITSAGRTRLRPILMTAFTTILALVPLALGDSAGLVGAELATVVIGGLLSSTFLTLVAVPVLYMLFEESAPRLFSRMFRRRQPAPEAPVSEGTPSTVADDAALDGSSEPPVEQSPP